MRRLRSVKIGYPSPKVVYIAFALRKLRDVICDVAYKQSYNANAKCKRGIRLEPSTPNITESYALCFTTVLFAGRAAWQSAAQKAGVGGFRSGLQVGMVTAALSGQ